MSDKPTYSASASVSTAGAPCIQRAPRRSGITLAARTLVVMLALTGAGLGLLAPEAGATTAPGQTATPYNQGGEWWSTDGCSVVPDSGWWGDFHHACVHHDGCYRNHWASKSTCDTWFYNDMRGIVCRDVPLVRLEEQSLQLPGIRLLLGRVLLRRTRLQRLEHLGRNAVLRPVLTFEPSRPEGGPDTSGPPSSLSCPREEPCTWSSL